MRLILVLFITVLLTGCGVGVGYQSVESFSLKGADIFLNEHDTTIRRSFNEEAGSADTRESVQNLWGTPLQKDAQQNGVEIWTYESKLTKEQGPIIGLIVPIPLTISTGHIKTVLTFKNNKLTQADSEKEVMFFCGYFVSDESAKWMCS
jgi:hypothetical protein